MGIENNDDGNGGNVSTSKMYLPPHEHTIGDDNDGNRWKVSTSTRIGGGVYQQAHVMMGIDDDDTGNGGDVLTSTCHYGDQR